MPRWLVLFGVLAASGGPELDAPYDCEPGQLEYQDASFWVIREPIRYTHEGPANGMPGKLDLTGASDHLLIEYSEPLVFEGDIVPARIAVKIGEDEYETCDVNGPFPGQLEIPATGVFVFEIENVARRFGCGRCDGFLCVPDDGHRVSGCYRAPK
ncbi:MAG: hypothetical protein HOV81_25200 [Kofleriaceae bacterium]|nr:hypothetical protein [Kofleriaceae bacterium]